MASLKNFVGLIILLISLCVMAFVGYVAYQVVNDLTDKTKKKMEKKNISFGKDGMKVSMKERTAEQESDSAQGLLVKAWNASGVTPPATQSNSSYFGKTSGTSGSTSSSTASTPGATPGVGAEKKWPFSRTPAGRPKA